MKVLQVIDTAGPGGAETVFLNLVRGLSARGIQVATLLPRDAWLTARLREAGVDPHLIDASGSFRLDYLLRLARLARRERADVIHAHLIGSATYSAVAGGIAGIPVVATFHGPTDLANALSLQGLRAWLLQKLPSVVTAVSRSTVTALQEFGITPARIKYIPNGIDTDFFAPDAPPTVRTDLGLGDDSVVFGAVGNVRPAKAYDVLLKAAALVVKHLPNARFIVAGQGNEAQMTPLRELRRELGLERQFHFLGHRQADAALYCSMDVFVSSSHSEGMPLSFLEAMACGRRVVATASGGAEEVLEEGRFGVIVPPASPERLASALVSASRPSPGSEAVSALTVRNHVVEKYSLKVMLDEYEDLYGAVA